MNNIILTITLILINTIYLPYNCKVDTVSFQAPAPLVPADDITFVNNPWYEG